MEYNTLYLQYTNTDHTQINGIGDIDWRKTKKLLKHSAEEECWKLYGQS